MTSDVQSYHRIRAERELAAAQAASDEKIAAIHRELAERHAAQAAGDAERAEAA